MVLAYSSFSNSTYLLEKNYRDGKHIRVYQKGEEIPLLDQGMWQVYRGFVELGTLHSNGDEVLLGWAKPDNFFGNWLNRIYPYRAIALSDVYLIWYSLKEIETNHKLGQFMLTQVMENLRQTETLLTIVAMKKVEDRLEKFLDLLAQKLGKSRDQGREIEIRLTHQQIANGINSTRVTTTKMLGDLQRQGKIKWTNDRHLVINY